MLLNTATGPVAKLYMSIMEDVIESMRELILEEGLEDRVLDELKQVWESKVVQSKALEDFRTNGTHSKFVLQLPANYNHPDRRPRVGIPASQSAHHFPLKKGSETLATFSLPPGLSYPVQIPAGVTLQTASGQLYKVNVPVVVTQGPAGSNPFSQTTQKIIEWREPCVSQPAVVPPVVNTIPSKEVAPPLVPPPPPPPSHPQPPAPQKTLTLNPGQENMAPQHSQVPLAENLHSQLSQQKQPEMIVEGGNEPGQEPGNTGAAELTSTTFPHGFLSLQTETLETLAQAPAGSFSKDIDDILKEVIEDEINKAVSEPEFANYPTLSDIVQLDGPVDNSDIEAEDEVPLEDNDFLGMINAEAMKALQEVDGSSDGDSSSSSSDSDGVDELADVVEEDPLNSGDDVIEQDIPDLFDTDNVIVCQYDKIHRSKNRWKFHLKDGVMCYGGRDYVFSKAVGEAEW
ncbi:TFIIA-alpha and beta-like factor [Merluccius polli]|uniref:TFIIA-alpha and beta-like factor n=1 Tax=Merluccius polli TaxID=89951 RepID=A0AA47M5B8_MERPO|nr:TFIIA-alpha and beta-like factor [Merluccius polli]KAK0133920.1 TFIIA-alpha and beta-like factor [Merluccius polli]